MLWMISVGAALAAEGFVEPEVEVLWSFAETGSGSFGWAVSALEDINGDGAAEVITSAPNARSNAGRVVVLSGRDGERLFAAVGEGSGLLGFAIADAGDLNGDGLHDVVAGAARAGEVVVYSGADFSELLRVASPEAGDFFGAAVSGAGDVNGDGTPDLLVGAETSDQVGQDAGRVYALSGVDGAVLYTIDGEAAGDHFGSGTGLVGDVNGDGVPDAVIGARDAGPTQAGRVYVTSGADGAVLHTLEDGAATGSLGYFFVGGVGDLDGDGVSDVYGGDFGHDGVATDAGAAFVWSGADGRLLHSFAGEAASEGLGTGRGAGDLDGDGVPDLSVGSWTSSAGAATAGQITVFSGADGAVLRRVTSLTAGENFGFDVVGVGDVDGDGGDDLVASAATGDTVYLIRGEPPAGADSASDSGDDTGAGEGDKGGCGCGGGAGAGWAWALGLGALWRRRRYMLASRSESVRASSNSTA